MGVVAGAVIEVQKFAPLGDPMEVKLKGFNLSLRKQGEFAKNLLAKTFEQIYTRSLPRNVKRVIRSVARDIQRGHKGHELEPKQLELAYATLYMRLYQQFGRPSETLMREAYQELKGILVSSASDDHENRLPLQSNSILDTVS